MIDHRDLPGVQLLDEQLRPPAAAHGAAHGGRLRNHGALHRQRVYAAFSSSRAWRRAATSSASAPSIRTISPTTSRSASWVTVVSAGSARASLAIEKCRSASEAICGRCVMQSDLTAARELAQARADRAGGLAADARVDLVEDERGGGAVVGDAEQREHDARELAAGRGLADGARGHAAVRREQELDGVGAARSRLARGQHDLEGRALHREVGEALGDGAREARGGLRRGRRGARRRGARARPWPPRAAPPPARSPPRRSRARRGAGGTARRTRAPRRSSRRACASGGRSRRAAPRRPPARPAPRRAPRHSRAAPRTGRPPRRAGRASARRARRAPASTPPTPSSAAPPAASSSLAPGAVVGLERLRGGVRGAAQRLDVPQALARREQLALLGLVRSGVVDLLKLEREQVELALAGARKARQVLERLLGGADVRHGPAHRPTRRPACSGPQNASSSSSCADASVSRRCSCWP